MKTMCEHHTKLYRRDKHTIGIYDDIEDEFNEMIDKCEKCNKLESKYNTIFEQNTNTINNIDDEIGLFKFSDSEISFPFDNPKLQKIDHHIGNKYNS
jgi:hypothetical protein